MQVTQRSRPHHDPDLTAQVRCMRRVAKCVVKRGRYQKWVEPQSRATIDIGIIKDDALDTVHDSLNSGLLQSVNCCLNAFGNISAHRQYNDLACEDFK